MKNLVCLFIISVYCSISFSQDFSIIRFGALGDGKTLNTTSIQTAIDACAKSGGGKVIVPTGVFVTGTLHLRSNIELHLEAGAVLLGSPRLNDYLPYNNVHYGMFYTENAENITISGQGTINGNGRFYFDSTRPKVLPAAATKYTRQGADFRKVTGGGLGDGPIVPLPRPYQMVLFSNCRQVTVREVLLADPPHWTLHMADCDGVLIDGIRLWTNLLVPNSDGIDITSCNNVVISNCDVRAGDDAIAVMGYDKYFELPGFKGLRHAADNVLISNCNLQSYSSGIRIGYTDQNSVRNVNISNCNITNSTRGIGIFLRDEGSLENIRVTNVNIETYLRTGDWWGNGEPIHISAVRGTEEGKLGVIRNVRFENITCRSENGILVYGSPKSVIEGLVFDKISLEMIPSKIEQVAGGNIDLRGCYGDSGLFKADIPAVRIQHVNNMEMRDVEVRWRNITMPWFTHGIDAKNFGDLRIRNFKGSGSPVNKSAKTVYAKDGTGFSIDNKSGLQLVNVR